MTFVIKTKPDCPYCDKAKELIGARPDPMIIQEYNTPERIAVFKVQEGFTTFPQIWHKGQYIGGCDALERYLDELDF